MNLSLHVKFDQYFVTSSFSDYLLFSQSALFSFHIVLTSHTGQMDRGGQDM